MHDHHDSTPRQPELDTEARAAFFRPFHAAELLRGGHGRPAPAALRTASPIRLRVTWDVEGFRGRTISTAEFHPARNLTGF